MTEFVLAPPLAAAIAAAFGLVVGSFLNVVVVRGARSERIGGRSRCDACLKILSPLELIPVVSYCIRKGRCRSCGAAFSVQHPIVEGGCAAGFAGLALYLLALAPPPALLPAILAFPALASLIVLIVSDIRFQILPDGATLAFGVFALAAALARGTLLGDGAAAAVLGLLLAAAWLASGGAWMGLGDAKLAAVLALALGYPASVAALLFSFWLGGIAGALLVLAGRSTLRSRLPFGPFLIAGALLAYPYAGPFFTLTGLSVIF